MLFFFFSSISLSSLFIIFFFENTSVCILFFLVIIFFSTLTLFVIGVEFLSFIFLLVYIGAISILFIFALIFLKLNFKFKPKNWSFEGFFIANLVFQKLFFLFLLLNYNLELTLLLQENTFNLNSHIMFKWQDLNILIYMFFSNPLYLIIIGFLLLLALVGSISLCLSI